MFRRCTPFFTLLQLGCGGNDADPCIVRRSAPAASGFNEAAASSPRLIARFALDDQIALPSTKPQPVHRGSFAPNPPTLAIPFSFNEATALLPRGHIVRIQPYEAVTAPSTKPRCYHRGHAPEGEIIRAKEIDSSTKRRRYHCGHLPNVPPALTLGDNLLQRSCGVITAITITMRSLFVPSFTFLNEAAALPPRSLRRFVTLNNGALSLQRSHGGLAVDTRLQAIRRGDHVLASTKPQR